VRAVDEALTDVLVPSTTSGSRRAWARIDLDALRHNFRLLSKMVAPAELCAVVKADAYGHGALSVARTVVSAGARWLAVATVEEGVALRDAGLGAEVLVLSEPPAEAMDEVVARVLRPTLYSARGIEAAASAASRAGEVLDVHLKLNTGMHRVGADEGELDSVLRSLEGSPQLRTTGLWTHLAVADGTSEEDRSFTRTQLARFAAMRERVEGVLGRVPLLHAANSAGAIAYPEARLGMVRCGIALYGSLPSPDVAPALEAAVQKAEGATLAESSGAPSGLRPVMSLVAEVCHVRRLEAGERPSYGRRRALPEDSVVATLPLGYADGVPRRYFDDGGTVLVGGRRRPLAGSVTMDQIMVDCGPDADVRVGDEVVLIGTQDGECISAWDWARVLGTISYEVLARIGPRVTRVPI
jgi:alanine racemase